MSNPLLRDKTVKIIKFCSLASPKNCRAQPTSHKDLHTSWYHRLTCINGDLSSLCFLWCEFFTNFQSAMWNMSRHDMLARGYQRHFFLTCLVTWKTCLLMSPRHVTKKLLEQGSQRQMSRHHDMSRHYWDMSSTSCHVFTRIRCHKTQDVSQEIGYNVVSRWHVANITATFST